MVMVRGVRLHGSTVRWPVAAPSTRACGTRRSAAPSLIACTNRPPPFAASRSPAGWQRASGKPQKARKARKARRQCNSGSSGRLIAPAASLHNTGCFARACSSVIEFWLSDRRAFTTSALPSTCVPRHSMPISGGHNTSFSCGYCEREGTTGYTSSVPATSA